MVNLAGELVDRRPTRAGIELLRRSRVEPTRALVEATASVTVPVSVFVQASTLAIYGDAGDELLDESSAAADHPPQMAGVATAWEAALEGARTDRLVVLRTGIVLDKDTRRSTGWWGSPDGGWVDASVRSTSGSAGCTSTTGSRSSASRSYPPVSRSRESCTQRRRTRFATGI